MTKQAALRLTVRMGVSGLTSARDARRVPFPPRISHRRRQGRPCRETNGESVWIVYSQNGTTQMGLLSAGQIGE
eukprot:4582002-Pyramimonas_sp.AAC.1